MLARMMNEYSPLMRLQSEMNRLFNGFLEDTPGTRPFSKAFPGVNLWEEGDKAFVEAELPGLTMNDIEVLVTGNEVTINGERKTSEQPQASWHRRERTAGRFSRTLTLPWEIDADKVQAKLQDGVLSLTLPKCEACKPKKVKVLPA